jgi:hypothetical protein
METIILTLAVYCLVKYIRYINDKAYEQGYERYREEQQEEAEEVFRKIKGE